MYTLQDAIKLNQENPTTFTIPSKTAIKNLQKGNIVKLIFLNEKNEGERMWVMITERNGDNFLGRLDNIPVQTEVKQGDIIQFESKHIIQIFNF